MIAPRWKKVLADLKAYKGKFATVIAALTITLLAITIMLTNNALLSRNMTESYTGTKPAQATIETDFVDDSLLKSVESLDYVQTADARGAGVFRIHSSDGGRFVLKLFVIRDFKDLRLAFFNLNSGALPLHKGEIAIERTASDIGLFPDGSEIVVQSPESTRTLTLSGTVHDPSLAPSWQERTVYGYVTPETYALFTGDPRLDDLKVIFREGLTKTEITDYSRRLSEWLISQGKPVYEILIPPPGRHPHQAMSEVILRLFITFAFLSLALGGILTAGIVNAIMVKETRQLGIMKILGGTSGQTALLYFALIGFISILSLMIALPIGTFIGSKFAVLMSQIMNFSTVTETVPLSIFITVITAGLVIPLGICAIPIVRISGITVRRALDENGTGENAVIKADKKTWKLPFPPFLNLAFRNTFRKKGRLALSVLLLSASTGLYLSARNIEKSWAMIVRSAVNQIVFDAEVRIYGTLGNDDLNRLVKNLPEIERAEGWGFATVSPGTEDGFRISGTYPDGGHGVFLLRGIPDSSKLFNAEIETGSGLTGTYANETVLNLRAVEQYGKAGIGDAVYLNVNGHIEKFICTGIANELGPAAAYIDRAYFQKITETQNRFSSFVMKWRDVSERNGTERMESVKKKLEAEGIKVSMIIPSSEFAKALDGHIYIIIYALIALSVIMAAVGLLGLASTFSTIVMERKKETAVLRTIGATDGKILLNLLLESLFISLISFAIGIAICLPTSLLIGSRLGMMAFLMPLPLEIAAPSLWLWLAISSTGALLSAIFPALNALKMTIREAIAFE